MMSTGLLLNSGIVLGMAAMFFGAHYGIRWLMYTGMVGVALLATLMITFIATQ